MKEVPCMNDEQLQLGIKLCEAVKGHPCLYDEESPDFQVRSRVAAAWKAISKECDDTVSNCRFRWKGIRSSFTRSFRKSRSNSQYYLYDHLEFLVPHLSLADKNDESVSQADDMDPSHIDKEDSVYNDSGTTESAEEAYKPTNRQVNAIRMDRGNYSELSQDVEPSEGRPSRTRKAPKRIYEPDPPTETQMEKRPKRLLERRKSVGGLVLREYIQKNNLGVENLEPELPKTIVIQSLDNSIELCKYKHDSKTKQRVQKETTDVGIFARPLTMDSCTVTETVTKCVDQGIQCDGNPRDLDDDFLDNLRPQIKTMNFRQKVNFKQRVYRALMEVLDDASNFPNDGDTIELPQPIAKHLESTTTGELRLIRELVSLVQAAKMSSEVVNATNTVTVVSPSSSTPASPNVDAEIADETDNQNTPTTEPISESSSQTSSAKSVDSLGIPRHILQRAVQVTGNCGGTLLAQNGEKRRVYRIYPKAPGAPPVVADKLTTQGPVVGTFIVTPPKSTQNKVFTPPASTNASSSSASNSAPIKIPAIQYPKIIKSSTTTSPMLPPTGNKFPPPPNDTTNNRTTPPPKIAINTQAQNTSIFRRRYSICGSALAGNLAAQQNKANAKPFTQPPSLATQQRQQPPKIQIQQQPKIQILPHQPKIQIPQQQPKTPAEQPQQPKTILQQQLKIKQQLQQQLQQQTLKHQQQQRQQQLKAQQYQQQMKLQHQMQQLKQQQQQQQQLQRQQSQQQSQMAKRSSLPIQSPSTTSSASSIQISQQASQKSATQTVNNVKTFFGNPTSPKRQHDSLEGLPGGSDTSNDTSALQTAGTIAADSFPEFPKPYFKLEPEE